MQDIFNFIGSSKLFFSHIVRHLLAILYEEKLIAITCFWFKSKASSKVVKIFILESRVDMVISLGPYIDSISNFNYFNFILVLIYTIFMLYLMLLWHTIFAFSRYISL